MEKKITNFSQKFFSRVLFILISLIIAAIFLLILLISSHNSADNQNPSNDTRQFHVLVIGSYENELITNQIFSGVEKASDKFDTVAELYIPSFQSDSTPIQNLLSYAAYLNADGVVAYINSPSTTLLPIYNQDDQPIPIVLTGTYNPDSDHVSYIGNSYSEIGKTVAEEALNALNFKGTVCIINGAQPTQQNQSNLLNSMQSSLKAHSSISYKIIPKITLNEQADLFICLSEEDTIQTVQFFQEFFPTRRFKIIGFGNNSTCDLYLDKGMIYELVTINPEKIGEEAMAALYEYITKGYTNNYITADVKIRRSTK